LPLALPAAVARHIALSVLRSHLLPLHLSRFCFLFACAAVVLTGCADSSSVSVHTQGGFSSDKRGSFRTLMSTRGRCVVVEAVIKRKVGSASHLHVVSSCKCAAPHPSSRALLEASSLSATRCPGGLCTDSTWLSVSRRRDLMSRLVCLHGAAARAGCSRGSGASCSSHGADCLPGGARDLANDAGDDGSRRFAPSFFPDWTESVSDM
jgi:hypothetical protein